MKSVNEEDTLLYKQDSKDSFDPESKLKLSKECSLERKEIVEQITRIKATGQKLFEQESKIKKELANKKYDKSYVLHVQNQQVLKYLMDHKHTLELNKKIKSIPLILKNQSNSPYLKKKLDSLQTILKKLSIFIAYAEKTKDRTNKFIQTQVYPQKELISKSTNIISSNVKELLIEIKVMKSYQYLSRKFYIQRNIDLFPTEQDKELFLNTSFFDLRLDSLSKCRNNV